MAKKTIPKKAIPKRAVSRQELLTQVEELRWRLDEAEETLRAIRAGEVDALVVYRPEGEQVYTLKGAERTYRIMMETMNEGALTLSSDGTILYCNTRFAELVKTPLEQVMGSAVRSFVTPAHQLRLEALLQAPSGKSEISLQASDATLVPCQFSTRFLPADDLPVTCVIVTDLTESVAAAQALRQTHDELRERIKEMAALQRISYLLQDHTRPMAELLQELVVSLPPAYQYPEITAARIVLGDEVFATPNYAPSPWMLWANLNQHGIIEVCYLEERPVEAEGPFLVQERAFLNTLAEMLQSHLERRQVEQERTASEIRFRTLAETTSAAIFIVEGLRILYANDAAQGVTGYMCDELLDMELWQLAHPTYQGVLRQHGLQHAWDEAIPNRFELRIVTKGGEDRWLDVTTGGIEYQGKSVLVVTAFDITERDRAEKELRQAKKELEARVAERTAELRQAAEQLQATNAELRVQTEELEVAGEELSSQNDQLRAAQQRLEAERWRYQELFDFAPGGYLVTGNDGTIREANRAAAQMLNVRADMLTGKPLTVFVTEPEHRALYSQLARLQQVQGTTQWEMQLQPREGAPFPVLIDVAPMVDAQGQRVGLRWLLRDITVLKQAEEQLRYQAALLANVNDAIIASDAQYRVTAWNRAAESLYGWKAEEVLGRNGLEIVCTEWPVADAAEMRRVIAETGRWRGEATQVCKDGTRVPVEVSSMVLRDKSGQITGYVSVNRDIAERKKAEQALRDSEAKANALIKYAPTAIYELDYQGSRFISVNDAMCQILGYTREELFSIGPAGLLDEPSRALFAERIRRQLVGEKIDESVEYRVRKRDGGFVDAALNVTFNTVPGESSRALVVAHDVTERKRMEEALRESRQRYQSLIETTSDFIWEMDPQGRYTYCSPQMEAMWGLKAQDMLGKTPFDLMPPDEKKRASGYFGEIVGSQKPFSGLVTSAQAGGGRLIFVETSGVPFFDVDGRFSGYRGISRDITERKRAEEALQRLNRTLTAHSHSDQALMRATNEAEYMHQVCEIIIQDCGHAMAWIGFAEEDEAKSVRPVAYAGFEKSYLETLHITWADTERGRGPTGTAIRTGQPSFCRNMLTDPNFAPWREEALKRGYASSLVLPMSDNGKVLGALTIYFRDPDPFTEQEVALLSGLADDLAYGIRTLRLRAAHEKAEAALRESEARYRALFEGMTEGFAVHEIICDEHGQPCDYRFLEINPAFERLTGLTREGVIGRTVRQVVPTVEPVWVQTYGRVALTGESVHFDEYNGELGRHYEVFAYCPAPRHFAALFMDITERKQMEEALLATNQELTRFNRVMVGRELRMIELKKEVNQLCQQRGQPLRYVLDFEKQE